MGKSYCPLLLYGIPQLHYIPKYPPKGIEAKSQAAKKLVGKRNWGNLVYYKNSLITWCHTTSFPQASVLFNEEILRQTFLFSLTLDVPCPKCCDCFPVGAPPGPGSAPGPSVRSGRRQGPKKEISVPQLQWGSVDHPMAFSKQRMLGPRSSLQALQLLSDSGGQRLSPTLDPAQDML